MKKTSKYKISDKLYRCECGKEFDNPQSLNAHFSHCLIHKEQTGQELVLKNRRVCGFESFDKNKIKKNKVKADLNENKIKEYNNKRNILINAYKNSGIDFTKSGWSTKLYNWLLQRNELFNKVVFRALKKYYPEFFNNNVWIRKGSILPK